MKTVSRENEDVETREPTRTGMTAPDKSNANVVPTFAAF
jgi:hypothetical protein